VCSLILVWRFRGDVINHEIEYFIESHTESFVNPIHQFLNRIEIKPSHVDENRKKMEIFMLDFLKKS
jgi:hypothetical protein